MKRVYLIRHGLPDFPQGARMCLGITDLPLSPEGLDQAKRMASALPPVSAVFSSPLTRAVQTSQAIRPEITVLPGLRELDFGEWDGLTFSQIRQRYPALYAARANDLTRMPPGAEVNADALARFSAAITQAARNSPGDFAVVTHGGVAALFLQAVTGTWYKPQYCETVALFWNQNRFYQQEESPCVKC